MRLLLLRGLLIADAAVLFLLGGLLIFEPVQVEKSFHFQDLPAAVAYLIGMWGCVMATMGFGYLVAATHPMRHRVWINIGIIRGALESVLGIFYLARGTVTFQQAGFGTLLAGFDGAGLRGAVPAPASSGGLEATSRGAAMKEIKFACPQCGQHIACDRDYADMCIAVPRVQPADGSAAAEHLRGCPLGSVHRGLGSHPKAALHLPHPDD